jgi:hypothetical protein
MEAAHDQTWCRALSLLISVPGRAIGMLRVSDLDAEHGQQGVQGEAWRKSHPGTRPSSYAVATDSMTRVATSEA